MEQNLRQKLLDEAAPDPTECWVLPPFSVVRKRHELIVAFYYFYNYPPRIAQMLWCPEPDREW